jgi:hypothetical protein
MGERDTVAGRKAGRRGRCFAMATPERAAPKDRPPLFLEGVNQSRCAGPSTSVARLGARRPDSAL